MTNPNVSDEFKESTKKVVADVGSSLSQAGKDALNAVSAEFKELSSNATETASAEVKARAEEGRDILADQTKRFADGLRQSSVGSHEDGIQSRLMNIFADGVESASDELRSQSLGSIWSDVKDVARRHPGAFVAGSGLLGFAVARFVMASDGSAPAQRGLLGVAGRSTSPRRDAPKAKFDNLGGNAASGVIAHGVVGVAGSSDYQDGTGEVDADNRFDGADPNKAKS